MLDNAIVCNFGSELSLVCVPSVLEAGLRVGLPAPLAEELGGQRTGPGLGGVLSVGKLLLTVLSCLMTVILNLFFF